MWQFLTGFSLGVYVGTFYDCRPAIKAVQIILRENMPKEKNKEKNKEKPIIKKEDEKQPSLFRWPFA